ncbi:hypothetical protein CTAYLR_010730 [Chrysophaeum taylorii]|uniref:J domain-containing protein n=1 Tax=Chrysophaeum taylorii TaxID=2483200 RepID=A0AAD7UJ40_9STRA|nr:hypothetical protein CTAYLR_010730 [Chrysophaeum taylorii]
MERVLECRYEEVRRIVSLRVRPPESWSRGPVRARILRAVAKASSFAAEDMEVVCGEQYVSRRATLASLGDGVVVVRRRREGRCFYVDDGIPRGRAPWRLARVDVEDVEGRREKEEVASLLAAAEGACAATREREARRALDVDPWSRAATTALVAALVEARRWAAAVDEVVESADFVTDPVLAARVLRAASLYEDAARRADDGGRHHAAKVAGDAAFAAEDFALAARAYGSAGLDHPTLALDRATALALAGDLEAAKHAYTAARDEHPFDARAARWLARCESVLCGLFGSVRRLEWAAVDDRALAKASKAADDLFCHLRVADPEFAALAARRADLEARRARLWARTKHFARLRVYGDDYHHPRDDDIELPAAEEPHRDATAYDILGVATTATTAQIRAAYKRRALETHPDKPAGDADTFLAVQGAQATLTDPARRAELDATLRRPSPVASAPLRRRVSCLYDVSARAS